MKTILLREYVELNTLLLFMVNCDLFESPSFRYSEDVLAITNFLQLFFIASKIKLRDFKTLNSKILSLKSVFLANTPLDARCTTTST